MKKKRFLTFPAVLLALGIATAALAAGGLDDPLISVSWLYHSLAPRLEAQFQKETDEKLDSLEADYSGRMDALHFASAGEYDYAAGFTRLDFSEGGSVELDTFGCFLMTEGRMRLLEGPCEVLDLSTGQVCAPGSWLEAQHKYFAAEGSGALFRAYSGAEGYVDGYYLHTAAGEIPPAERFTDVDGHWAREQILMLAELGVVKGTDEDLFSPEAKVTRAMFVTVLGRLFGADDTVAESRFSDVKPSDWFAPYVQWASEFGIVTGNEDGTFAPNRNITREQMAAILIRFCGAFGYVLPEVNGEESFADVDEISAWALDSVELARRTGLMTGRSGGIFDPGGTASRAEMCAVISRLYEKLNVAEGANGE